MAVSPDESNLYATERDRYGVEARLDAGSHRREIQAASEGQQAGTEELRKLIELLRKQAIASQTYAETMAETVRESILLLDSNLRVITVNGSFLRTFKVSREEVEKRPLEELGNGQWKIPALLHLLGEILPRQSELRNFVVSLVFPAIGQKVMLLNARRIHRAQDSEQVILLAMEDVTEQRRAIDDARRRTELLHLAHDGIIVRDLKSSVLFWNRGAEEMYGWTAGEACGNVTHQFLQTVFPEPFDQVHDKLFTSGYWEGELVHSTRDGRRITVASRQVLQMDQQGRATGILEINRDITLRKEAEESLRNLSARLLQLQDEERRRIARELHDSIRPMLSCCRTLLAWPRKPPMRLGRSRICSILPRWTILACTRHWSGTSRGSPSAAR
jgi:two-component system CheB/CheR fusion protein